MIPSWTLTLSILAALWQDHGTALNYSFCEVENIRPTFSLKSVSMLRLVDLKVPSHTIRGQPVRLDCHYDLEGEALYSVKWYKDLHEFFRFLPGDEPPSQIVNLTGVNVDLAKSSDNSVTLKNLDLSGSGVYRCEVSGEAPTFQTVGESAQMIVVDLPYGGLGPQIEGTRPRYQVGDTVRINCTSSRSRPAAKLAWFINQDPVSQMLAEEALLQHFPISIDEDGLETSVLGLQFKVKHKHFKMNGDLKMKCLATIANLYWRSNEESVEGDKPQKAPALESREISPGRREASSSVGRMGHQTTSPTTLASLHHLTVTLTTLCSLIVSSAFASDLR